MAYYHYTNSFFIIKNKIIYITKETELLYLFLLFEIFGLEIADTNYGLPVIDRAQFTQRHTFWYLFKQTESVGQTASMTG